MSLSASALAADIAAAVGHPGDVSGPVTGFAQGIIDEITQNGVASVGPPAGNTISGLTGAGMAAKVAAAGGFGSVSGTLLAYCSAVANYIMANAMISYTGPGLPLPFSTGGTISGLSGSAMATMVAADCGYPGVSAILLAKCTAITNHIMANGQANAGIIS